MVPSRLKTTVLLFSNLAMFSSETGSTGGASTLRGSTGDPFIKNLKSRCGPVESPLLPT
jgi:hypothetical protein